MSNTTPSLLLALFLGACGGGSTELSVDARARLAEQPLGDLIYAGLVFPEDRDEPSFRYTRHATRDGRLSTHATYEIGSEDVIVLQRARHSESYALHDFNEIHVQTGAVSSVRVREDGGLRFTVRRHGQTTTCDEGSGAPVVVGPTLFGFVLQRWDELARGDTVPVRFAAPDQCRSYAFELRLEEASDGRTTISFVASDFFVRLAVSPMRLVFDDASRRIVRYVGRVPPLLDGDTIVARSEYEHIAARYR